MKLLIVLSALLLQDAAASTQVTGTALAWRDHQVEIEEFLKTGPIERFEEGSSTATGRKSPPTSSTSCSTST